MGPPFGIPNDRHCGGRAVACQKFGWRPKQVGVLLRYRGWRWQGSGVASNPPLATVVINMPPPHQILSFQLTVLDLAVRQSANQWTPTVGERKKRGLIGGGNDGSFRQAAVPILCAASKRFVIRPRVAAVLRSFSSARESVDADGRRKEEASLIGGGNGNSFRQAAVRILCAASKRFVIGPQMSRPCCIALQSSWSI